MPEQLFGETHDIRRIVSNEPKQEVRRSIESEIPAAAWAWLRDQVAYSGSQSVQEHLRRTNLLVDGTVLDRNQLFADGRIIPTTLVRYAYHYVDTINTAARLDQWIDYAQKIWPLLILNPRIGRGLSEEESKSFAAHTDMAVKTYIHEREITFPELTAEAIVFKYRLPDLYEQSEFSELFWPLLCDQVARLDVDMWDYLDCMIAAKILYPDRRLPSVVESDVKDSNLTTIQIDIKAGESEWTSAFGRAADLKLATARRLTLTENGLEIESDDNRQLEVPTTSQFPDQRRY